MKRKFDNAGVYAVQQEILMMNPKDRLRIIYLIRKDFRTFMLNTFALTESQEQQVKNLHGEILEELSNGVASSLENNQMVNFQKDSKNKDESIKDIMLGSSTTNEQIKATYTTAPIALSIHIRYREE